MVGERAGFLNRFFYHPNFNVVAGLFGIVGTILAVYFYRASIQKPDLTYYISPTRTPIVQKGNLDNFSVTFQGTPINGDLSTAEIQIWNQGNAPIFSNDILVPVSIRLTNGETIYQASANTTRDVIGFNWLSPTNRPTGQIQFNWKILEQNDGVKLQIIYGGNVHSAFEVNGTIVKQNQIRLEKFSTDSLTAFPYKTLGLLSALAGLLLITILSSFSGQKLKKIDLYYLTFMFMLAVVAMVMFLLEILHARFAKPPFGF